MHQFDTTLNLSFLQKTLLILVFASFPISTFAQNNTSQKKKEKPSLFSNNKASANYVSELKKVKLFTDYGISEAISQYRDSEVWENETRRVFTYNVDRTEIEVDYSTYDTEESIWVDAGTFTYVYTNDGFPKSSSISIQQTGYSYKTEQVFYYTEKNLDSLTFSVDENQGGETNSFYEVVRLNYLENDSIRVTGEITEDGLTEESEASYYVQKGDDLVEVLEYPDAGEGEYLLDRYTYSGITFQAYIKSAFDEFELIEVYNDEYYQGEGWIPYSRSTVNEETSFLTTLLTEYYENEGWIEEYRDTYNLENGQITSVEEATFIGSAWIIDYRTNYTYGEPVSIETEELSKSFSLKQNYPNPFNPNTTISFEIRNSGFVTLKVYNILGKEVSTLVSELKSVGNYTTNFDASSLPSGVYYYTLATQSFTETKAMTLLK